MICLTDEAGGEEVEEGGEGVYARTGEVEDYVDMVVSRNKRSWV